MKVSIVGTVGLPSKYGGFETLVDNLAAYHAKHFSTKIDLTVYCSAHAYSEPINMIYSTNLEYVNLKANGISSIIYDITSIWRSIKCGTDVVLILGVSGAIFLPFARLISRTRYVVNLDGLEHRRKKWNGLARIFLKVSEKIAIKYSHEIIADNKAISLYIFEEYNKLSTMISYGGDHANHPTDRVVGNLDNLSKVIPASYCIGLCRIEPENNVAEILEAFSKTDMNLVFVGNWENSTYGRYLLNSFSNFQNITLLPPIYDKEQLYFLRKNASAYIHGHSAGGTNPALVEMMHFGIPIYAFDCSFNRFTTENNAKFFKNPEELVALLKEKKDHGIGSLLQAVAQREYVWDTICAKYFQLICKQ